MLFPPKVRNRRKALRSRFDIAQQFEHIEESCIPSYVHSNPLAAWVAWMRLLQAANLYQKWAPNGDVLDFGSATGEIGQLIAQRGAYCFIEDNELLVQALLYWLKDARRIKFDDLCDNQFAAIFALDSLEHNREIEPLIVRLKASLIKSGILILSGPTENVLYRLGRRLAGFQGHYHFQNIWDIEALIKRHMSLLDRKVVPMGVPLFSISVWRVEQ